MTTKIDTSKWPTLPEVSQLLGRSPKTVDRWVREGKLRKELRPVPRRKPIPVFDPRHVLRMQEELAAGETLVENAALTISLNEREKHLQQHAAPPPAASVELAQALHSFSEAQQQMAATFSRALEMVAQGLVHAREPQAAALSAPAAAPVALTLSLEEAVAYTGLADSHLRRLIRTQELRNFGTRRDPRLSRAQLDAAILGGGGGSKTEAAAG